MVGASEAEQGQESARWQGCEPQVGAGRERVGHLQGRRALDRTKDGGRRIGLGDGK